MIAENILIWNVRGLNSQARRNVVRELVVQERISLISLQETKLDDCDDRLILDMFGPLFDYFYLPAAHTCGGIFLAWRKDIWSASNHVNRDYTLTAKIVHNATGLIGGSQVSMGHKATRKKSCS